MPEIAPVEPEENPNPKNYCRPSTLVALYHPSHR